MSQFIIDKKGKLIDVPDDNYELYEKMQRRYELDRAFAKGALLASVSILSVIAIMGALKCFKII